MLSLCLLPLLAPLQDATEPVRFERTAFVMGTSLIMEVTAENEEKALAASESALRAVEAVEARLSTWREDSELSKLNRAPVGKPTPISAELFKDLTFAHVAWSETAGAFDAGLGCLVEAWGLREGGRQPSPEAIELCTSKGGQRALDFVEGSATRRTAECRIEEGGFGKGGGLDAAIDALRVAGVREATLDLGGQVATLGKTEKRFALAHPRDRERALLSYTLPSGSCATSGNSERGIVVDGKRLGHLLDPRTGAPAPDFGSMSVVHDRAWIADAFSTGLFVLGPERALQFGNQTDGFDVIVIEVVEEGALRVRASVGLKGRLRAEEDGLAIEYSRPAQPPQRATDR